MKTELERQHEHENCRKQLIVDKHNLDTELCQQSSRFDFAGQRWAEALSWQATLKSQLNELDNKVEEVYARTSLKIREQLKAKGEKTTEDLIKAMTIVHEDVQKSKEEYLRVERALINAQTWTNKWESTKKAFESRGPDIRDMGSLLLAGYFQVDSIKIK